MLASASPRRMRLLGQLGVPFDVFDPGEVEASTEGDPEERASENALAKALAVAGRLVSGLVIAADTLIEIEGRVLGKPSTREEALEMLLSLRGSSHRVITGVAVVDAGTGKCDVRAAETVVQMRPYSDEEAALYVSTGEPMGKAGGYAMQGLGAVLVEGVEGCCHNVVGLPLQVLNGMLLSFGVDVLGFNSGMRGARMGVRG